VFLSMARKHKDLVNRAQTCISIAPDQLFGSGMLRKRKEELLVMRDKLRIKDTGGKEQYSKSVLDSRIEDFEIIEKIIMEK
jgi:hypothetical protein